MPQYTPPRTRFPRSVYFSTFPMSCMRVLTEMVGEPRSANALPIPIVARCIEIHSPTVDPDDRQRLRWRVRGSKKDPAVDNIICGANIDQLLREFAWLLVLRMKVHPQSKKECWKSKEDRTKGAEPELLFHRSKIRIVDGGSSAESKSDFRGWGEMCSRGSGTGHKRNIAKSRLHS
jgi:hypothetical protein